MNIGAKTILTIFIMLSSSLSWALECKMETDVQGAGHYVQIDKGPFPVYIEATEGPYHVRIFLDKNGTRPKASFVFDANTSIDFRSHLIAKIRADKFDLIASQDYMASDRFVRVWCKGL